MNDREYIRLRRQLDEDYRRKVKALDTVWEMANGSTPPPETDGTSDKGGRVAFSKEIISVFEQLPQVFSTKDVEDELRHVKLSAQMDRSTVSHTLKRAAQDGLLEVVEVGRGQRPTVYRQKNFEDKCSVAQLSRIKLLSVSANAPITAMKRVFLESHGAMSTRELSRDQARELIAKLRRRQPDFEGKPNEVESGQARQKKASSVALHEFVPSDLGDSSVDMADISDI